MAGTPRELNQVIWAGIEQQRRLADALPILIMVSDGHGNVQFFNRAWHELTGQPADPDALDDWQGYLHPDDAPRVASTWYQAVEAGRRTVTVRYRVRDHRSGEYRWVSARAVAIENEAGAIVQWVGAAVDVSDDVTARERLNASLAEQTALAGILQRSLLPPMLPNVAGLTFDTEYRPSAEYTLLGGDWYDATALPDGRVMFSIGDVMGHGIGAATEMGRVRQALLTAAVNAPDPPEVLRRVNRVMQLQGTVATAIVGIVDGAERVVRLASAGHPRALLRSPDGAIREVIAAGAPLGVMRELDCEGLTIVAAPGDALVLYTDGLTEYARDIESAERQLVAALSADPMVPGCAARLCDAVLGDAAATDDIAVMVLCFAGG